jgi:hypothetical protein
VEYAQAIRLPTWIAAILNDRKCSNEIATLDNVDFIHLCLFSNIGCFMKGGRKNFGEVSKSQPTKTKQKMGQLFG